MENVIITVIVIVAVGLASLYIWKAKKEGKKCIGCPSGASGSCPKHCGCGSSGKKEK